MKNKLLVTGFAMVMAFAFISCENKSDVTGTCEDMVKESIHKSPRSLSELKGKTITIAEYDFMGGVNDNRMLYRIIQFGDSIDTPKRVDTMTYEYGEWNELNTAYSLYVTPRSGSQYTLWYRGNALVAPDGRVYGGEGTSNTARVEKLEKTIASFPNTKWEAMFRDELVMDSVFRDSIRWIPFPKPGHADTIPWFDHMDTVSADTTCYFYMEFDRDADTYANTGRFYQRGVRSTYNRGTKQIDTISVDTASYAFRWYFSEVSSDSKFIITLFNTTSEGKDEILNISKYKTDDEGVAKEFLLGGLTYTRPVR